MNIDAIHYIDGIEMTVMHPRTGEPLLMSSGEPMMIRLGSEQSDAFKTVQRRYQQERLRNPNRKLTPEQIDARAIELLAAVTYDWTLEGSDGPIPFSAAAARALYADADKAWLRQQVTDFVYEPTNHLGESFAA